MQARLAKLSKQAPASMGRGGGAAAAASAEADDTDEGFEHRMRAQALAKRAALGRDSAAAAPASRCCCTDQSQAHGVVGGHLDQHVMAGAAMQHPNPCSLRPCCAPSQTSAGCTRPADSTMELLYQGPAAEMLYKLHCCLMPLAEGNAMLNASFPFYCRNGGARPKDSDEDSDNDSDDGGGDRGRNDADKRRSAALAGGSKAALIKPSRQVAVCRLS